MIILSVHSTTPYLGVAITDGEETLAERIAAPGKRHLENLPGLVSEALSTSGVTLNQVDAFAAAIGPGSFSGVRIGLAAVKGYCLALKKPVLGVSSLDILIAQAAYDVDCAFAVIDAGRGDIYTVYATGISSERVVIDTPVMASIADFPAHIRRMTSGVPVICGASIIGKLGLDSDTADLRLVEAPFPSVCGLLAHRRLMNSDVDDHLLLTPIYMRKSDAEEKKSSASMV